MLVLEPEKGSLLDMMHHGLIQKIYDKTALVAVIGMGYVGLPLALTFADKGFKVIGFDVDPEKVKSLNSGLSYIKHIPNEVIRAHVETGRFEMTSDFARLREPDSILICVPTPLTQDREPDLSHIESTARMIVPHLRHGQLVVLESTTYPGCTKSVVNPILEQGGLTSGKEFFLAYSPEREDPGNPEFATSRIPKVVGGDGPQALSAAIALYDQIVIQTVPVSSMDVAEAVKLTENIFRSVNIALVNELKMVYRKMDVDIWEVIEAAKSKPFGYMPFYPGPGLGGHCIPIDPFYLSWRAKQVGEETKFIELAGEINTSMPEKVISVLVAALKGRSGKSIKNAKILLLGLAYKKNIDDTRESPAFSLIEIMEEKGAIVDYHDPLIPKIPTTRKHAKLAGRPSVACSSSLLQAVDAVIICTDHDDIDYSLVAESAQLIVDTRGVLQSLNLTSPNITQA